MVHALVSMVPWVSLVSLLLLLFFFFVFFLVFFLGEHTVALMLKDEHVHRSKLIMI